MTLFEAVALHKVLNSDRCHRFAGITLLGAATATGKGAAPADADMSSSSAEEDSSSGSGSGSSSDDESGSSSSGMEEDAPQQKTAAPAQKKPAPAAAASVRSAAGGNGPTLKQARTGSGTGDKKPTKAVKAVQKRLDASSFDDLAAISAIIAGANVPGEPAVQNLSDAIKSKSGSKRARD